MTCSAEFLLLLVVLAIGAAAFGERLVWVQGVGVALVLGGIGLVQSAKKKISS